MDNKRHLIAIMQQQSTVDMLKTLVKNKRAKPEALEQAERRLAELQELQEPGDNAPEFLPQRALTPPDFKTEILHRLPIADPPIHTALPVPEVMTIARNLMKQIDDLKKQIAAISNSMHLVPEDVPCPELMQEAQALKKEEEALWTKYRFLEKNGHLPEVPEEEEQQRSLELLDAIDKKKKLIDKRYKLRIRIENPANLRNKRLELWKDELTQAELDYQYYDDLIRMLKDR